MRKLEPLFHITKRGDLSFWKSFLIKGILILSGFIFACLILLLIANVNPIDTIREMFLGCFGTEKRIWNLLKEMGLLLLVALALVPAFRMKFWNLGGNGQILIGALVTICCMFYMGNAGVSETVIIIVMIPAAIIAGALWAVIPAIFKAFFNTNESLFTLMMNYIAAGLVNIFLTKAVTSGSGTLGILNYGYIRPLANQPALLVIIFAITTLLLIWSYFKFTRHGFEIMIVGESRNTAKYLGVNSKKVIIRTILISGAICGFVGLLLAGSISRTITSNSDNNMGFTAIMVAWLAKFDCFAMVGTSFMVAFISRGMNQVRTYASITNTSIGDIVIGVIYFFIIASEFFTRYKVKLSIHKKKEDTINTSLEGGK